MKKLDYLERKIMLAGRLSLILLGAIFLVFAVWWAVLSVPNGWRLYLNETTETSLQKVEGFKPDAKAFEDAVLSAQATTSGVDEDELKLQAAMKTPEFATHYDSIINKIRGFAESKPEDRKRIDTAAENEGYTPLAPLEFEAVDKYSKLCTGDAAAAAAAAVEAAEAAAEAATDSTSDAAADATADAGQTESEEGMDAEQSDEPAADPYCGRNTVRGLIVESLNTVIYNASNDEEKRTLHKNFVAGLDSAVTSYLDGKTPRDSLFALSTVQIASTLITSYTSTFSEKMNDSSSSEPSMGDEMDKLTKGFTPLTLIANPFVIGTLAFLMIFVNLMMMLAVIRIGRRLEKEPDSKS